MNIAGLQKFTMVDFPGLIAATVFTRGCTFACPFCHNPELVLPSKFIPLLDNDEIMAFFEKRKNQLKGICITGGEPTLQKDLPEFIQKLKDIGYKIKLDTNGTNPEMLEQLIKSGNIDYIAMDVKTTLEKYSSVVNPKSEIRNLKQISNSNNQNLKTSSHSEHSFCHSKQSEESFMIDPSAEFTPLIAGSQDDKLIRYIKKSIYLIMQSDIDYEFRTTVCHPIHEVLDFEEIGELIKGAKRYYIQNFVQSKHIDEHQKFKPFLDEELFSAKKNMKKYIKEVDLR